MPSLPGVGVLFQRANDIFAKVEEGSVDLGITGYDVVQEHRREDDPVVVLYPKLGYGRCALVLAVPEAWIDVTTMADLADVAASFRARGRELRIATKYPNLTRRFLHEHAIAHFTIVESSGALEAAPTLGYADVVADLMTSGVTLRENRLKTIQGGIILESEACLIGNREALRCSPEKRALTRSMLELIEAYLRSRRYCRVTANVRSTSEAAVVRLITTHGEVAGLRGPTVARVHPKVGGEDGWFGVTVVVDRGLLLKTVEVLRRAGASEIMVSPLTYVFESKSWSYEALERQLEAPPGEMEEWWERS